MKLGELGLVRRRAVEVHGRRWRDSLRGGDTVELRVRAWAAPPAVRMVDEAGGIHTGEVESE